jgi:hypothetical protein
VALDRRYVEGSFLVIIGHGCLQTGGAVGGQAVSQARSAGGKDVVAKHNQSGTRRIDHEVEKVTIDCRKVRRVEE